MSSKRSAAPEAPATSNAYLQIGEVAERTGVTQRTLRFYEEMGLLNPPPRLDGGFRLYSDDDVARVERIKKLQTLLNLSLADIKEMVDAEEEQIQLRAGYRRDARISERRAKLREAVDIIERQTAIIDQKLGALHEMKAHLDERRNKCHAWLQGLDEQEAVQRAARA